MASRQVIHTRPTLVACPHPPPMTGRPAPGSRAPGVDMLISAVRYPVLEREGN